MADDDALDVVRHYRRLYNQGMDHAAVRHALELGWAEAIADSDDGPVFWFAVAAAQWEFGALDADLLVRIQEIAEQGRGLDRWREGGPSLLAKREQAVREFLHVVRQRNPRPKKRTVEKRHPPVYLPGACLAAELGDGTFGAVLVLATDDRHETEGFDIVALLEWRSADKPPLRTFRQRQLIRPDADGRLIPVVRKCFARFHKPVRGKLTQVGQLARPESEETHLRTRFQGRWQEAITDLEHYFGLRS
ncbi:hypothetical protein [Urbifossiella limnaea]|uniref:hypothetical protein n=1 Tax=Urbifossiella limnaea TaxID=2528023 RepID=UPI00119E0942|nr:hypothetical protein [Urbifossiella limnaea]